MTALHRPDDEVEGRYWTGTRIGLGIVVALMTVMWGWIYLFAPRTNVDRLANRSFASEADAVCAPHQAEIDDLPDGNEGMTPQERAVQVSQGTELTRRMVAGLHDAASTVTDVDDRRLIDAWLADWDAYVDDRTDHIVRLEQAAPDASARDLVFILQDRAPGGAYTTRIDGFANVNDMGSCHVPGDI
ncbi:MAG: hypothetical protein R2695_22110 [Acidimicrobiales bacterium]